MTEAALPTPLERLQLREALQDRWRDRVRRITELSVDLHTALDGDEPRDPDPAALAVTLIEERRRLAEIEEAMRRLDDRSYGRCLRCRTPIPLRVLLHEPETRDCSGCGAAGPVLAAGAAAAH